MKAKGCYFNILKLFEFFDATIWHAFCFIHGFWVVPVRVCVPVAAASDSKWSRFGASRGMNQEYRAQPVGFLLKTISNP
ncbi:MAG: hypothetical protein EA399_13135 [Desulfovibrionales bacterium]|nr:MAG: hypothetical protein EA399_13135 [Desulfovibrionales bacterium]